MNIFRGALAFVALVIVALFVECRNESGSANSAPPSTAATSATATTPNAPQLHRAAPSDDCTDATADEQYCPEPCVIFVDVTTRSNDRCACVPGKIWIQGGQTVIWKGREDNNSGKHVALDTVGGVTFADPANPSKPKKGNVKLADPNCSSGECVKTFNELGMRRCTAYGYTVKLHHNGVLKKKDPEIEVGSTNTIDVGVTSTKSQPR